MSEYEKSHTACRLWCWWRCQLGQRRRHSRDDEGDPRDTKTQTHLQVAQTPDCLSRSHPTFRLTRSFPITPQTPTTSTHTHTPSSSPIVSIMLAAISHQTLWLGTFRTTYTRWIHITHTTHNKWASWSWVACHGGTYIMICVCVCDYVEKRWICMSTQPQTSKPASTSSRTTRRANKHTFNQRRKHPAEQHQPTEWSKNNNNKIIHKLSTNTSFELCMDIYFSHSIFKLCYLNARTVNTPHQRHLSREFANNYGARDSREVCACALLVLNRFCVVTFVCVSVCYLLTNVSVQRHKQIANVRKRNWGLCGFTSAFFRVSIIQQNIIQIHTNLLNSK